MNNISSPDRMLRAILGLVLLQLAYFWLAGPWQIAAGIAGGVLIVTAAMRFCPIYRICKLSTARGATPGKGKVWTALAIALLAAVAQGRPRVAHRRRQPRLHHLAQRPAYKGTNGAKGDDLPQPAVQHGGKPQAQGHIRRIDRNQPRIPSGAHGRTVKD